MATINPPNLYSAGAVVFNTQPSTNFAIQLLQQKKAKEEALDQYYQNLPRTINEAGMRDNERPKFMQSIAELQKYWQANRDAIKNPRLDGGAAQYNFERMFRGTREIVDASKQLAKTDLEVGKHWWDPNSRYMFRNQGFIDRLDRHNIPYGDPGHEPLNLATLTQPPRPRSAEDWQKLNGVLTAGLKIGETPTGRVDDLGDFNKRHYIVKQHSDDNLKVIGKRAEQVYQTDYDWQGEADAQYEAALQNPEALAPYNALFQRVMQRPIAGAQDFFAAQRIAEQAQAVNDFVDKKDSFAEWQARNTITNAQENERAARKDKKDGSPSGPIGNVLNTIQLSPEHVEGQWYTMNTDGNKQNLASIQQLLGDKVMPLTSITGERAKDPKERVEYIVGKGPGGEKQVEALRYKGLVYKRGDFDRLAALLDKEPAWSGRLRYPEAQQTAPGMVRPLKGADPKAQKRPMKKAEWAKLPLSERLKLKDQIQLID